MSDRELLEMAAKAAGIRWDTQECVWYGEGVSPRWDPLHEDGDALRLAVKLGIDLMVRVGIGSRATFHDDSELVHVSEEPDPYAATRLAIVRAAAEIGRQMKGA